MVGWLFWLVVSVALIAVVASVLAAYRSSKQEHHPVGAPDMAARVTHPLRYPRTVLCFVFLLASVVPFVHLIGLCLSGERHLGDFTKESFATFGLATLLGAFAVATLFVWRRAHFVASVLFFGHWGGMMFMDITTNALAGHVFGSVGDAVLEYGFRLFVLALAVAGLAVEIIYEQRTADPGA